MQCNKRSGLCPVHCCQGFTLLEVIVALGIVAVGILAVSQAITGYAGTTASLETRMVANWVAGNRLETLRMLAAKPVPGTEQGSEEMAERTWYFSETTSTTAVPLLFRVDITVFTDRDETDEVGTLTGYLLDTPEFSNKNTNIPPILGLGRNQPAAVKQPTRTGLP